LNQLIRGCAGDGLTTAARGKDHRRQITFEVQFNNCGVSRNFQHERRHCQRGRVGNIHILELGARRCKVPYIVEIATNRIGRHIRDIEVVGSVVHRQAIDNSIQKDGIDAAVRFIDRLISVRDRVDQVALKFINNHRFGRRPAVGRSLPVIGVMVLLVVRTEEAEPDTSVHSQARRDLPVVLEVWFDDLVTLVVFALRAILLEGGCTASEEIAHQKVGECIAGCTGGRLVAEGEEALHISGCRADGSVDLVTLKDDPLRAELQIVLSPGLRDVIAEAVHRIAVLPRHVASWEVRPLGSR
jgi:hypothetical protein